MNEYIQIKNQFGCGFCPTFILKMSFSSVSMHRLISLSQQPERENGKQRTDQWESQLNYRLSTLDDDFIRKVKKQLKWTGEKIYSFSVTLPELPSFSTAWKRQLGISTLWEFLLSIFLLFLAGGRVAGLCFASLYDKKAQKEKKYKPDRHNCIQYKT